MSENFGPAFADRPVPLLSYGLPFASSLLKHVDDTFHASKLYVVCSKSLAKNTSYLDDLKQQLGDKLVGTRVGMRSHSLWSEILEVVADVKRCEADCIVTLGAGSLTDAAKVVSYVSDRLSTACTPTSQIKRDTRVFLCNSPSSLNTRCN
jgi:alcohol dehydrogenase class IV